MTSLCNLNSPGQLKDNLSQTTTDVQIEDTQDFSKKMRRSTIDFNADYMDLRSAEQVYQQNT